jgi:mitochondrial fission process protein 1
MPWWGKSDPKPQAEPPKEAENASKTTSFDPDKLPQNRKLPQGLQKIVDKADEDNSFFDDVVEG